MDICGSQNKGWLLATAVSNVSNAIKVMFFQSHHVINGYKTAIWENRHGKEKWLQYAGAAGLSNKKMDIILKRLQERAKLYASIYFLPHMDLHPIHK